MVKIRFLLLPLLVTLPCFGMHQNIKFTVNGRPVKFHDVDSKLQRMDIHQLHSFLDSGCKIKAIRLDNGDYIVRPSVPGLGGGPIFGAITAIVTYTATGVAAVGTMIGVSIVTGGNIPAGLVAGAAVGKVGCELSTAATLAATAAPTAIVPYQ